MAKRELLPDVEHRKSRYLNNRAENSHRPNPPARAADAEVQIGAAGAALPIGPRFHLWPLPSATSQDNSQELPGRACHRLQDLDRGDVRPKRRVTALWSQPPARTRPWTVKLTMPARRLCHSRDQTLKSHRTASHRRQDATARAACSITSTTTSGKVTGMAWEEFTSVT